MRAVFAAVGHFRFFFLLSANSPTQTSGALQSGTLSGAISSTKSSRLLQGLTIMDSKQMRACCKRSRPKGRQQFGIALSLGVLFGNYTSHRQLSNICVSSSLRRLLVWWARKKNQHIRGGLAGARAVLQTPPKERSCFRLPRNCV